MSQEIRVVPAAVLESALKSLAGVAPGRFAVEAELRAIVDAPVPPAVQDRESKVNELVELMDRLSGGMRHFAGAIIDAGWTKLVPPAGGEVERYQAVALFTEEGNKINYNSPGPWIVKASEYDAHVTRLQAENAALQLRLNTADQRVDELQKDKERLDALEANYWDVRHHSSPLADTGDYTSCVEIVGHWMDKPNERVIGENYNDNLRAAIDQAMTADAYPPARPEYPELDAALAEEDWHMNPCKQGHRDVGACQGKAFCHTCDETITAETTQQAFEQWNATHPAVPQ